MIRAVITAMVHEDRVDHLWCSTICSQYWSLGGTDCEGRPFPGQKAKEVCHRRLWDAIYLCAFSPQK